MHIGLIGGIGPAATDFYYRRLISTFADKKTALELTIVHADTPTLLSNLASNNAAAQVAIYMRLTKRLVAVGAECVVVTSIAGHFCIDAFKAASPLPVVDLISEVNRAIEQRGLKRIGILGTRTAMETRFYGGVSSAQIIPPNGQDLDDVHQAYIDMATAGVVTEAQRKVFNIVSQRLLNEDGAQAIMLGGTDLALAFNEKNASFPIVDCAGIHADAIARLAIP
jgi:aspartate racemase